jgi:hypothetical protein
MNNLQGWLRLNIVLSITWIIFVCTVAGYKYFELRSEGSPTQSSQSQFNAPSISIQEEQEFRARANPEGFTKEELIGAVATPEKGHSVPFDPDAYLSNRGIASLQKRNPAPTNVGSNNSPYSPKSYKSPPANPFDQFDDLPGASQTSQTSSPHNPTGKFYSSTSEQLTWGHIRTLYLVLIIPLGILWLLLPLIVWSVVWVRAGFKQS